MTNDDNVEDLVKMVWIAPFCIAVVCFLFLISIGKAFDSASKIAEDIYILTSVFVCAFFLQTKKPAIVKILLVLFLAISFYYVLSIETIGIEIVIAAFVVCSAIILLGIHNRNNPKREFVVTIILGLILTITVTILAYCIYYKSTQKSEHVGCLVETEQQQYNAEFTTYDGYTNIKGANIKALIRNVMTHNRSVAGEDEDISELIQVRIGGPSDTPLEDAKRMVTNSNDSENLSIEDIAAYNENINNELSKIKNGWSYALACGYDPETGYVTDINIVQVENKETTNTVIKSK